MLKTIMPVIKWSGSKRHIAKEVVSKFPNKINTYYEPFVGGGSILAQFLISGKNVNNYVASDINKDLIGLWTTIRDNPDFLLDFYTEKWSILNSHKTESEKSNYYITQRELYNKERKPEQFLFLSRTCYCGLVRYNKKGNSNVAFHLNRPGILPEKLGVLLKFWSNLIQPVEFKCCDYREIAPKPGDYIFIDSPYFNVSSPLYNGNIVFDDFVDYLSKLKCQYSVTLDGKNANDDRTCLLPEHLGVTHEYLKIGNSSMRRVKGDTQNIVFESLYTKQ